MNDLVSHHIGQQIAAAAGRSEGDVVYTPVCWILAEFEGDVCPRLRGSVGVCVLRVALRLHAAYDPI